MTPKIFVSQQFDSDFKFVEKSVQKVLQKSYEHKSIDLCTFPPFSTVTTVYESSQPSYFLGVNFFATFSTFSKLASNSALLYSYRNIWGNVY